MASRYRARRWLCVAALAAPLLLAPSAFADPSGADKAQARALMQQGDEAVAAKDLHAALRAYQAAHAIMNVPSTGLEVARTQAALGMLVEAHDTAESVARLPKPADEPPAFERARSDAGRLADDLAARVPTLQLEIVGPSDPARVEVRLDGNVVLPGARTAPLRVNPGKHALRASASGFHEANVEVTVQERDKSPVRLRLEADAVAAPALAPTTAAAPPAAIDTVTPDAPRSSWSTQRTVALVVGGVGLAGVGVGAVFGLMAKSKNDDAQAPENCPNERQCYPAGKALLDDASSAATISTIAFAAGGAAVAAGVVLFVTAPSHARARVPASSLRVYPGGVAIRHTF